MKPRILLESSRTPDGSGELRLYRRENDFSITFDGRELMGSRMHGSEDLLAELACGPVADRPRARALVGGLGLGYTLAAALRVLNADAQVVVAELVPAVVRWNRTVLGNLAGHPLDDPRVIVQEHDVCALLRHEPNAYDAVMLDVDNSPDSMTQASNDWLYTASGLAAVYASLRPRGVLTVWSAGPDSGFTRRLKRAGFSACEKTVGARERGRGGRHTIWVAARPD